MRSVSVSLTATVVVLVVAGMLPCMGWVQWFGALAAGIAIIAGLVGLLTDRSSDGAGRHVGAHVAAIVAGVLGGGLGALRCLLGGGVL